VCNTTAAFSGGEASLGITLNTTGVHTLTVDVDGITFGRDLTVEVREPAAPAASTLTPERGAAGVARDAAVSVEFDCDLTENDLSGIKIEYENGGSVQELGGVSGTLSNNTITIVHDEFAYSTEYTVTVPAGAVKSPDDLGNPEVTWSFMTEAAPDLSDFNVAVVDPGLPKYTGIPFDLDISNAVDAGGQNLTGDINVTVTSVPKYEENPVPQELYNGPVAFSGGEAAVSLTVTGMDPQAYIQTYTFTVNVEAITATRELDVAVHKQTAPEEEALMPADGATGLPANTEVSVVFDREIFAGSNIESIYIKKEGEESPREVSGTINGRKLTINHGGLEYQTEYTVTVPQDTVRNNVGKYNANFIRWNFTTGSAAKVEVYYSDTDPTRSNVEVWIHPKREGRQFTITNNNGSNDYVFTENGSFTFEFEDNLGNPGQYTVSVDWIIEEKPAFDHFEYIPCLNGNEEVPEPTNESIYVILYVKYEDGEVDSMGQAKVFSENGQYSFEAEHFSSNKVYSYPLTVDWIDKEAPEISVAKSVYTPTAEDVILTITPSEAVNLSVTNAGGQSLFQEDVSGSHDLAVQENCELTITAEDPAGNTSEKAVTIDNIFKDAPVLTYTGAQAIAAERGREEEALDSILSYMTAEDKQGNDISEDIEFAVKNSEINQFGDELLTYEFQVENEAGLGSNKIFVDMLVVERLSPAIFVDGEEVDNRITLEVPSGKASLTTAIDFAGFMGEYTVKLSGGEKPPAAFKKENVAYNSRVSGGKIEPFNLTPGTYTVYAYDQEMLDKSVVVEVVKGGEQQ
ncbi:MAG: Ig-like domain-containing protein, partial [Clostridiales bacterium]|nr:Ig-like domain-containing protein [Clostridiales bacterium]